MSFYVKGQNYAKVCKRRQFFIIWWTIPFRGRRPLVKCYIHSPCGQVFCLVCVMLAFRQITWPYHGSCLRRERVVVGILAITRGHVRYAARPWRPRAERGIVLRRKCCGPCGRWRVTKYHYICARRLCWQPNDNIELKLQQQWDSLTLLHQEYRKEKRTEGKQNDVGWGGFLVKCVGVRALCLCFSMHHVFEHFTYI